MKPARSILTLRKHQQTRTVIIGSVLIWPLIIATGMAAVTGLAGGAAAGG